MTKNKGSIISVFPEAVIYSNELNLNSEKIITYLNKLNFNRIKKEECVCYVSKNFNIFNEIPFLRKQIESHVKNYLYNIFNYKMDYKFLNSWATKTNKNGNDEKHVHCNTFLSGVYYPIGNENFKIKFYKKKNEFWDIKCKEYNEFNSKEVIFKIDKNNTLLLFPSDLEHSIVKNNSEITRYSIAFNINPKGYIGEDDAKVFF
jgi:uncharacterized protein (TIGR02466 family)